MLRPLLLLTLLCLAVAACGGAPAAPAASVNVQATVEAAVKATAVAQPPAAPTAVPPTAAPTAPPAPAATPTERTINGVPVRKTGCRLADLCVTPDETLAVRVTEALTSDTTGNPLIKPGPGNTYLVVNLIIGNFGKGPLAYNPLYAKVKDASGREYPSNIMASGAITGGLQNGNLAPGDTVQGIIVFEVPTGSRGFRLTYQPLVFPQPAPLVVDLGQ